MIYISCKTVRSSTNIPEPEYTAISFEQHGGHILQNCSVKHCNSSVYVTESTQLY